MHPEAAIAPDLAPRIRVGLDLVEVRRIRDSVDRFGERFLGRLYSSGELDAARRGGGWSAESLAARFAAKEAAIKAFDLGEAGIDWRDIEVRSLPGGRCELALHGPVAGRAADLGVNQISLSLTHDGDYAGAVVTAWCGQAPSSSFSPP